MDIRWDPSSIQIGRIKARAGPFRGAKANDTFDVSTNVNHSIARNSCGSILLEPVKKGTRVNIIHRGINKTVSSVERVVNGSNVCFFSAGVSVMLARLARNSTDARK